MPSRLPTPDTTFLYPGETDFRKINDAINSVAQQSFAPNTIQATPETGNWAHSGGWTDIPGMELEFTVPVRSKAILNYSLRMYVLTYVNNSPWYTRVNTNGTVSNNSIIMWDPIGGGATSRINHVGFWMLEDLIPGTLYTWKVQALVSPVGSTYWVQKDYSQMMIRTEPRQRI